MAKIENSRLLKSKSTALKSTIAVEQHADRYYGELIITRCIHNQQGKDIKKFATAEKRVKCFTKMTFNY